VRLFSKREAVVLDLERDESEDKRPENRCEEQEPDGTESARARAISAAALQPREREALGDEQ
jgi:hypothetical protein